MNYRKLIEVREKVVQLDQFFVDENGEQQNAYITLQPISRQTQSKINTLTVRGQTINTKDGTVK